MKDLSTATPKGNEYLTVKEACALLKVGKNAMYDLIRTKRVKAIKLSPCRTRVTRRALDAYMAQLEIEQARPLLDQRKLRLVGRG